MRFSQILQVLPLAGSAAAFSVRRDDTGEPVGAIDTTNQFIIEVDSVSDVETISAKLTEGKSARVIKTFKSDIFIGLAIESNEDNLDTISEISHVARAWPAHLVHVPELEAVNSFRDLPDAANYSVHKWTGVDKAHESGNFGQGIKIGVVDTGIDYTHEALGGGFGPEYKISGGWDFVGDIWSGNGFENIIPDDDPMDQRGHGTHVAGIIAGESEWFTGVAPQAELLAYKVFASQGSTYDFHLIDSFIRAYEDGCDIITASIGGGAGGGWSNEAWATVASRIVDKGVIVTISAGNDGTFGPFYASTGSSGKGVVAVAAAQAGTLLADSAFELSITLDGEMSKTKQALQVFRPWDYVDVPIVALYEDFDVENQACPGNLPPNMPDIEGKIVLLRRGGCEYVQQILSLRALGPLGLMFVNIEDARPDFPGAPISFPMSLVDIQVGKAIFEALAEGASVTADFAKYSDEDQYIGIDNAIGGHPAYFTSWGALFDLDNKPDITGPGAQILSTEMDQTWGVKSGTSMSCPYVAGVAALYLHATGGRETRGEGVALEFYNKVIASGKTMRWGTVDASLPPPSSFWAPSFQVGSGLVDAWGVINTTTTLSTARFLLNDTANFQGQQTVDITNTADVDVQYTFQLQPAGGVYVGMPSGPGLVRLQGVEAVSMVPDFEAPTGTFTVRPGETKTASFTFDYPRGLNTARQPFYSGKVLVSSSAGESLSISYFGAAFDLRGHYEEIFAQPPTMTKSSSTFDLSRPSPDYVILFVSFAWGCDEIRFDLYESDWEESQWSYPPVVGENGYVGSATNWRHSFISTGFNPNLHDAEDTVAYPLRAFSRDLVIFSGIGLTTHRLIWLGKLADGSYIAPGQYRMRLAALRPFGNRANAADWDVWNGPAAHFTVLPAATS